MPKKRTISLSLISLLSVLCAIVAIGYQPVFKPGDLNRDYKTDLADLSYHFHRAAVALDSAGSLNDTVFNNHGIIDSIDTMWIAWELGGYSYYNPVYTHPDSLYPLNETALNLAVRHLSYLKSIWPYRRVQIDRMLRQFGLSSQPPVPINPDLTGDGHTDIADIVRFFTLLADSLEVLPDMAVAEQMDFNVDGRVDLIDTEAFLWRLSNDMYRQEWEGYPPGKNIFGETHDLSPAPSLGEKAARFAQRQLSWVHENVSEETTHLLDAHLRQFCRVYGLRYPPPPPLLGDLDDDSTRGPADAALFFNFLYTKAPAGLYDERMDFNLDSKVDSLDAEFFMFLLLREPGGTLSVPSSGIPPMPRLSKRQALDYLAGLPETHPEWVDVSGRHRSDELYRLLLPVKVPDSFDPDLNGDGKVDILDLLTLIRWGSAGDKRADWNGDNLYRADDLLQFIMEALYNK